MAAKNMQVTANNQEESVDQILDSIKDTLTAKIPNYDVLILTEKLEEEVIPNANNDNLNTEEEEILINPETAKNTTRILKDFLNKKKALNKSKDDIISGDKTVEEIVRELLKPQLACWLNENLPAIVTSIIEKEIKNLLPKNN